MLTSESPLPRTLPAPMILPPSPAGRSRVVVVAAGATVAEIVAHALPGATAAELARTRVSLVTAVRQAVVDQPLWHRCRPHRGVRVLIQVAPGKNALGTILQILVLVVAIALAAWLSPMLANVWGLSQATWSGIIMAGVSAVGMLALQHFMPTPKDEKEKKRFAISGVANRPNPGGPLPVLYGRMRVGVTLLAPPYSEIIGDQQWVRMLGVVSTGPVTMTDWWIGDTKVEEFGTDIQMDVREGWPSDTPSTLYPRQIREDSISEDLVCEIPEDDFGEPIKGAVAVPKKITKTTATDVSAISVILAFPSGLVSFKQSNGKKFHATMTVVIEARAVGAAEDDPWTEILSTSIVRRTTEAFFVAHEWTVPSRGPAYDVRCHTTTTTNGTSKKYTETKRMVWAALQSIRNERPFIPPIPCAIVAVRMMATAQVNGQIETLSCLASRIAPDWDSDSRTWVARETRSPAAAMRLALQGPHVRRPKVTSAIDLAALADWSEHCDRKGLHYDALITEEVSIVDQRAEIGAAGRAVLRWDGRMYRVAIDRPAAVVDHITPINSSGFEWERVYVNVPDAFRVSFPSSDDDYRIRERLIPWPGHTGDIGRTESLPIKGKTDPDEIWREARRRQYQIEHRPDQIRVMQPGHLRVAERGDRVALTAPTITSVQTSAVVTRVTGTLVELDREVALDSPPYAMRWMRYTGSDTVGSSVIGRISQPAGTQRLVQLVGQTQVPSEGAIVAIGPEGAVTLECLVRGIEMGEEQTQILHLVAAADEIEALTDAEQPPPWSGRVGSALGSASDMPLAPVIVSAATTDEGNIAIVLAPASADPAIIGRYRLWHRRQGESAWTEREIPAMSSSLEIAGYADGDAVEIKAQAVSVYAIDGAETAVLTWIVGEDVEPIPVVVDLAVERVTDGWALSWRLDRSDPDIDYADVAGIAVRARGGTWTAWDDLTEVTSGDISPPWVSTTPLSDGGLYTWAVRAFDSDDRMGPMDLVTVSGVISTAILVGLDNGIVLADDDGSLISVE